MSAEELIDLPNGRYTDTTILIDSAGNEAYVGVLPEFEISATGLYKGRAGVLGSVFGRRQLGWDTTTTLADVSYYLDNTQQQNTPVVHGTTYYIRSSSVEDAAGGTGIRTMRINTLNGLGETTILTVTLNGTTGVSLGNNISYVQYMESASEGSLGVAAGDIKIASVAGVPTVAQTVEMIPAGDGKSMSGRMKVPTGHTLFLLGWKASAISNTMDVRLRANVFSDTKAVTTGFHFQQMAYLSSGTIFSDETHYERFPAGTEIKLSAISGGVASGNRCDASFHYIMVATTEPIL